MPTVLLAHSNAELRTSLARELQSRGFETADFPDIEGALDAAGLKPVVALLVEILLLEREEFEVGTRLDLRAGRAVPILVLNHRATAEEMKSLRRHGAGLLARPVDDLDRLATQLKIQSEAPWEEPGSNEPGPSSSRRPTPSGAGEIRETVGTPGNRRKRRDAAAADAAAADAAAVAAPLPPPPAPLRAPPPPRAAPPPPPMAAVPVGAASGAALSAQTVAMSLSAPAPAPPPPTPPPPEERVSPIFLTPVPTSGSLLPPEALAPDPPPRPRVVPPPPAKAPAPLSEVMRTDVYFAPSTAKTEAEPAPAEDPFFASSWEVPLPPDPPQAPIEVDLGVPEMQTELAPLPPPPALPATRPPVPPPRVELSFELEDLAKPAPAPAPPKVPPPRIPASERLPGLMFAGEEDDQLFVDKFSESTQVQEMSSKRQMLEADAGQPPEEATNRMPIPAVKRLDPPPVPTDSNPADVTNPSVTGSFRIPPEMVMQADSKESPAAPTPPPVSTGDTDWFQDSEEERTTAEPIPAKAESSEALRLDASAANAQNFPGIQMGEGNGPVVLVVDDEPTFRGFLKETLAAEGYRVHTAINAPNALRFLKSDTTVNLVISDLNMPHMDGFELKHEMDIWCGRKLPFIVVSADTSTEKIEIAARVGAAAIVPKPIDDLEAFYAIVKDTLRDAGIG